MTTQTTETVAFVSADVLAAFVANIVKAAKTHASADRNLVGSLLASARDIGRPVDEAAWDEYFAKAARKGIAAKVSADSVKVYVAHAKCVTRAATGRPPISDALPLGKHWTDQRTSGRKLEGVNAYYKRVSALLKLATPNEAGELILPEGYSLLGEVTASPTADTPAADTPADTGSAGTSADAEGGLNINPAEAKADARETAATVLMGNPKAAALLLALLADKEGQDALAKLMSDHAKAAKEAKAKAEAEAKAGEAFNKAA
jgi:hypothetical protein